MEELKFKLLKRRLNRDKIIISDDDLNRIISIYNHIIDFSLEECKKKYDSPYCFIVLPKKLFDSDTTDFYEIFINLIRMNKNNLLNYLDYAFLLDSDVFGYARDPLFNLNNYLSQINKYYGIYGDDFILEYYENNNYVIENTIDNNYEYITKSKFIDDNYKNVIRLFKEAFEKYDTLISSNELDDFYPDVYMNDYLNALFYYFIINNLIKTDYENVCNYLKNIIDDITEFFDKINLVGIANEHELFNYVDYSYKNSKGKVKVIK